MLNQFNSENSYTDCCTHPATWKGVWKWVELQLILAWIQVFCFIILKSVLGRLSPK